MKAHSRILEPANSLLLVIDLQEAYRGKLFQETRTLEAAKRLLAASDLLGIPVLLAEQYPKGLGPTLEEIEAVLPEKATRFQKTSFSCQGSGDFQKILQSAGRSQIVITGIETHVCVNQTVHDLLHQSFQVHLAREAITARFELEDSQGFSKMIQSGAIPGCVESILFEWCRDAKAPSFKPLQKLVV